MYRVEVFSNKRPAITSLNTEWTESTHFGAERLWHNIIMAINGDLSTMYSTNPMAHRVSNKSFKI